MSGTRLLMTADALGGVWQYAIELAAALVPHGVNTTLATLGPAPDPAQRREAAAIPGLTLVDTGLPLDWMCDAAAPVLAAGRAIATLAAEASVDLVQLNTPALAAGAAFPVPVVAVTHGCVGTWWEAARTEPLGPDLAWSAELTREGLGRADRVVAPSAAYAAIVQRRYALPRSPLVVHNGRTPPPPAAAPAAPADHVLTVGRLWDTVKRTALLDAVAAALPVPLFAAGAAIGPHGEGSATDHLVTLGQIDAAGIAAQLAGRPIFVSAASFEPFGLAVLEAAQAGCPLVLSDIATFRELWEGAALFVPGDDPAGFVAAIRQVRADPALRADLGRRAEARSSRYTPAATAGAMANLYAGLAALPPAAKQRAA